MGLALILRGTKQRDREKRLTKDSDFKSSQEGQVGVTIGHQAPVRSLVFPGHCMDGESPRGERSEGVIVEKPGKGRRGVRLHFHCEGHVGALRHPNHLSVEYTRLQLDFNGVRTI